MCGLDLDPWQQLVLEVGMEVQEDGRWAASSVDVVASRQNGKNAAIEARELYGVVMLGEVFIHTAHQFKTTKESFGRLLDLVNGDSEVRRRLIYKVSSPASGYEMRFSGGGRVQFIARSRTSGRGLTGDVLVLDEAQDLDDDAVGALLPTISSGPAGNRQAWFMGSAPGPTALVWHRRRTEGRQGEAERRAYFEFSADPDSDLDDPEAWAQANPGLGRRLMLEAIEAERGEMSDEMFARERLSISPELAVLGAVIPADAWDGCRDPLSGVPERAMPAFAVDIAPDRSVGCVAASGWRQDGLKHVEIVEHRPGTAWIIPFLGELRAKWRQSRIVADLSGPAGSILAESVAERVGVEAVGAREHAQACGAFYDMVTAGSLRHRGDRLLDAALAGATRRKMGDAWLWSRRDSTVDISPLVAATLACWAAPPRAKPRVRAFNLAEALERV